MKQEMLQLLAAFLGSVGFGLIFHLKLPRLLPAAAGGLLAWGMYLFCGAFLQGTFLPSLISTAVVMFYSEFLARKLKAPVTVFLIPGVVPLIPGSLLYYTMSYAVQGLWEEGTRYGYQTVQSALGIAAGMSLAYALMDIWSAIHKELLRNVKKNIKK